MSCLLPRRLAAAVVLGATLSGLGAQAPVTPPPGVAPQADGTPATIAVPGSVPWFQPPLWTRPAQPEWIQPGWVQPGWMQPEWLQPQWAQAQWAQPQWIRPDGAPGGRPQDQAFDPFILVDATPGPATASPAAAVVARTLYEAQAAVRSAETQGTPAAIVRGLAQMDGLIAKIRSASWKLPEGQHPALTNAASVPVNLLG